MQILTATFWQFSDRFEQFFSRLPISSFKVFFGLDYF